MHRFYRYSITAIVFFLSLVLGALAGQGNFVERGSDNPPKDPSDLCRSAAILAAKKHDVPLSVLWAISLVETGRKVDGTFRPWPWAVNVEGKGVWFDTREKAERFVLDAFSNGVRSYDSGCFQINFKWHRAAFDTPVSMFDPDISADYASKFLRALFEELGDWSVAAGAYHSRNDKFASKYRARFDALRNLDLDLEPIVAHATPSAGGQRSLPLVLVSNGTHSAGSLFPISPNNPPRLVDLFPTRGAIFDD